MPRFFDAQMFTHSYDVAYSTMASPEDQTPSSVRLRYPSSTMQTVKYFRIYLTGFGTKIAENPVVIYYVGEEIKSQTEGLDSTIIPRSE